MWLLQVCCGLVITRMSHNHFLLPEQPFVTRTPLQRYLSSVEYPHLGKEKKRHVTRTPDLIRLRPLGCSKSEQSTSCNANK